MYLPVPRSVLCLALASLWACHDPENASRALDGGLTARSDDDATAADADLAAGDRDGAGDEATADDPTAPSALSGVRVAPGADFDADLAALVAYKRPVPTSSDCPGLFIAGSCGDGRCAGPDETADNCPADCVFHLVGSYNDLPICPSYMEMVRPHSSAEVADILRRAVHEGKRARAIGNRHSASQTICGDGIAIDMSAMSAAQDVRIEGSVAYAPAGILLSTLGDTLREKGVGIGFAHLGFRNVTLAGAIGTSAHGSSPVHNAAVAHRVVSLTLVRWNGDIQTFTERDTPSDLFRALTTHLGLFGVITEVGVTVSPAENLDTEVSFVDESVLLGDDGPMASLAGCDFAQFNWFPRHQQAMRWCGKLTDAPIVDADNTLLDPGVSADLASLAKTGFHAGTCDSALNETLEDVRLSQLKDSPPIVIHRPDGSDEHVSRAVGAVHRMTSANLIELGKQKYFQMDWEVAIPQQYAADALRAAKQVFDAHDVSLPGVGVFVRFAKVERGGWLSYHSRGGAFAEGDSAMFFESPVAVPVGYSDSELRAYLHIYEGLVGLFVRHFGARAHWGKNLDSVFDLERSVGTFAGRIDKINAAVAELDPYGVFANDFARRLGVVWPREGENPNLTLSQDSCSCGRASEVRCDVRHAVTYASSCFASCAGVAESELVRFPCAALDIAPCSIFDTRTCVWEHIAKERDANTPPITRF